MSLYDKNIGHTFTRDHEIKYGICSLSARRVSFFSLISSRNILENCHELLYGIK